MILLEYQNIKTFLPNAMFQIGLRTYWSEGIFRIKKFKSTVLWAYVFSDLKGKEIVGTFHEKELQKRNQNKFRVGKVIKKKGNKLYVKGKGHNSSFNSWIDKKHIV